MRVAGRQDKEIVWDPFCGSGLELIESALAGGVGQVVGTDIDPAAIAIAEANFKAAKLPGTKAAFHTADFRDIIRIPELDRGKVSLVISNPPLGRRVRTMVEAYVGGQWTAFSTTERDFLGRLPLGIETSFADGSAKSWR